MKMLSKYFKIRFVALFILMGTNTLVFAQPCSEFIQTEVSCNGGSDGTITITINRGTAPYNFAIYYGLGDQAISGAPNNVHTFTGIPADDISIVCQYWNAPANKFTTCPVTITTITEPPALTANAVVTNNICSGGTIGAIDLTVAGGTAPYTYSWSNGASTQDISNLAQGTYSVTVTDAKNCVQARSYSITTPTPIVITPSITNVSCNGGNNGAIDITLSGGTAPYGNFSWSNGPVTEDISGLTEGNYTVNLTDANGCPANGNFNISQPAVLTATGIESHVTCNGGNNGFINLTVSGGTTPYSYVWSNGASSQDIGSLIAGNYSVTVTDALGCTANANFTINQPLAIIITPATTNVSCNGGSNGAIYITVSNGTAPYGNFSWSNGALTEDISGLTAGSYTVNLTDANGCPANATFNVTQPAPITITTATTNVTCNAGNNGAINITVGGGTAPYSNFSWNNGALTEDIAGLTAGSYTVNLTDANGCPANATFNVTQPTPIVITPATTNVSCNGGSNGAIDITVSGGNAPYGNFSWTNGALTEDISGLAAGSYTVNLTDANGCPANATFNVSEPALLTANGIESHVNCNAGNNGSINLTVNGGTAPYSYVWSNGASSQDIASLIAGNYSVTVTDALGCTANANFTINEPLAIIITPTIIDATCTGINNGSIDITVSGGTAPYGNFSWSNGALTEDISGLAAGSYTINLTDAIGCPANATFNINQPLSIDITPSTTDVTCNGGNNGAIDITVSGGTAPYNNFSWTNGAVTEDISGLTAGSYTVNLTDANGCSANATFNVTQPIAILITPATTNVSCNAGSNGAIDITVSGGTAPYNSFSWTNGALTEDISGLTAGSYTINLTDVNGCPANATFNVSEPALLTANGIESHVTCNAGNNGAIDLTVNGGTTPYTFVWDNGASSEDIASLIAGNYSVTVTDALSCIANANFTINEPLAITITPAIIDATCTGINNGSIDITVSGGTAPYGNFSWTNGALTEDISGLAAGSYTINLTDDLGCPANATFNVSQPGDLSINGVPTNATCNGVNNGSIDLSVSGGTTPYSYSWTNGALTEDVSGLATGSYSVTVTDDNGCNLSETFNINSASSLALTIDIDNITCNGTSTGSIDITNVSGGTAPYSYLWNTGAGTQNIIGLPIGNYSVRVTDGLGCFQDSSITLTQPTALDLTATFESPICATGNYGQVTLIGLGGGGNYFYSMDGTTYNSPNPIVGLNPGSYTFYVKDANNCVATLDTTIASFPQVNLAAINPTITHITCNGVNNGSINLGPVSGGMGPYTYVLDGTITKTTPIFPGAGDPGLSAGNHTIKIIDNSNACEYDTILTINTVAPVLPSITPTNETCSNGDGKIVLTAITGGTTPSNYAYKFENQPETNYSGGPVEFDSLTSGTYTIIVYDKNVNCANTVKVPLSKKPNPVPYVRDSIPRCFGTTDGHIYIDSIQSGTPTFTITIQEIDSVFNGTYSGVGSNNSLDFEVAYGYYKMTITDQECPAYIRPITYYYLYNGTDYDTIRTDTIFINQPAPVRAEVFSSSTDRYTNSGLAGIHNFSGGSSPYSYSWDNTNFSYINSDTLLLNGLGKGTYTVYIRDVKGCPLPMTFTIDADFFIPNLITPNDDKNNDVFEIIGLPNESEVRIFNKWGSRVYFSKNYDNSWDGNNEPSGVYFYELLLPNNKLYKGWLEVIR